jgi:hypothetical protein
MGTEKASAFMLYILAVHVESYAANFNSVSYIQP